MRNEPINSAKPPGNFQLLRPLIGSAALFGASQVLARGSFVLAFMMLAHGLAPAALSEISFFLLTLQLLSAYASLGIGVAATCHFALAHDEKADVRSQIHALVVISCASAGLMILIVPLVWPMVTSRPLDWLFLAALLCLVIDLIPQSAILGLGRYSKGLLVSAISGFVLLSGSALAAAHSSARLAAAAIMLSYAAKLAGDIAFGIRGLGRGFWRPFRVTGSDVRNVLSLVGPMATTSVLAGSGAWLVGELIRARWADLDYALFAAGLQWYAIGLFLPGMLTTVLFPLQVRAAQSTAISPHESRRLLIHGVALASATSAAVLVASIPFSPLILRLYGAAFAGHTWIIWGFLGAAALLAPTFSMSHQLIALKKQQWWTALMAVWLAVLIGTALLTIPRGVEYSALSFGVANLALLLFTGAAVAKFEAAPSGPSQEAVNPASSAGCEGP